MKAVLEFDLDVHEDLLSYNRAVNATRAYIAIYEIQNLLKTKREYEAVNENVIEKLEEDIYGILENRRINLEDLE
jgi:hypothetical protein